MQVWVPVAHDVVPLLQALLGLLVQETPAAHGTQAPALLQTMSVPQTEPVPFNMAVSMQVMTPVSQLVTPVRHRLGLVSQPWPAVHEPQLPFPSQTRLVPHEVPPDLLPPS